MTFTSTSQSTTEGSQRSAQTPELKLRLQRKLLTRSFHALSTYFLRHPQRHLSRGDATHRRSGQVSHQCSIKKMPPQICTQVNLKDATPAEVPSWRMALLCVKLIKDSQHNLECLQHFLLCGSSSLWKLMNLNID